MLFFSVSPPGGTDSVKTARPVGKKGAVLNAHFILTKPEVCVCFKSLGLLVGLVLRKRGYSV